MKINIGIPPLLQAIQPSTRRAQKARTLLPIIPLAFGVIARGAPAPATSIGALLAADPGYQVVERGQDFAVFRKITPTTASAGYTVFRTNQFTLLENGLHYLENGEWKLSEDIVEPFPGGAVARHGPHKTIFSPEPGAEAVFDIQTPEGQRIRGGVRSIQLTDIAAGKSLVLATVKESVPGEIVPPNQVVYRSGFEGLDADVLLVWRHNSISQNVVLKERPMLPEGMNPATTRLEVVSELVESPEPVLNQAVVKEPGKPDLHDDVTIGFGSLLAVHGKAFPVNGENALVLTGGPVTDNRSVSVVKEFRKLEDGRRFIMESVGWQEIEPMLKNLPSAARAANSQPSEKQAADSRVWPSRVAATPKLEPLLVAALPYKTAGFLLDLDFGVSVSDYTFLSGSTYYFPTNFSVGPGAAVFQPGCVIKYASNIYLLLYGYIDCPAAGQLMPVFTSKDDDLFGDLIPDSTHNPTFAASPALWVYYETAYTEIQNIRVRWAQRGIEYDANPGVSIVHSLHDSLFQQCQTGVYVNQPSGGLTLSAVRKCNVTTPITGCCDISGSMTDDCGPLYTVASFAGLNEPEAGSNPPDTMGAVGPRHFMVVVNGAVAVFDKYSGVRRSPNPTSLDSFLRLTVTSGPYAGDYPTGGAGDPRIVYDHGSQRWIACAIDGGIGGSHQVLLAVSHGSDPVGAGGSNWVSNNWTKYLVPFGPCSNTDFDTLGVDSNAIYICASGGTADGCFATVKLAALPKGPFLDGSAQQVQSNFVMDVETGTGSPITQPSVQFDSITIDDPAWFIFENGGELRYNRLKWANGFAQRPIWLDPVPWPPLAIPASYYDLLSGAISPPQLGSAIGVGRLDSRLMMAMVRKIGSTQYLWTCHHIGVNSAGNNDNGMADRSAVEWFKIQPTPSVMIAESGRIYDTNSNPKFYYMPSLVVNKNGDMVVGFSGSSVNEYIGAYYTGRLNSGSSPNAPIRFYAGKDWFDTDDYVWWGDYSHTTLDPDALTIWTIQEYAETRTTPPPDCWGTRIVAVTSF